MIRSVVARTFLRTAATATLSLSLIIVTPAVFADFPLLSDRTADHLEGLANDSFVKTLGVADYNNDGFDDIAIARRDADPILLINESGVLTNRSVELFSSFAASRNATYVEPFDANNDGFIDLAFAVLDMPVTLHLNLGMSNGVWQGFGAATDLTAGVNALTLGSGDISGDGTADDLFINPILADKVLLINDGTAKFRDASDQLDTLKDTINNGHFGLVGDANNDGVDDIMYIEADDHLFVYYNDGEGNFSNERRLSLQNEHFGQPLAYTCGCADFNGDGIFDFAVHADGGGDDQLVSFMSTGAIDADGVPELVLVEQPGVPGRMSRRHGLPDVGDLDGDGDLDYVQSSLERVHGTLALRPIGVRTLAAFNTDINSGIFEAFVGEDWGQEDSHDVKLIDINSDGNLDMFIGHDTRYGVYINTAAPRTIELDQSVTMSPTEVGGSATLQVSLLSGTNTSYLWDFGDGSSETTSVPTAEHVYTAPGHYAVTVTVSGVEGSDQVNFKQSIFSGLTAQQPSSSTGMVFQTRSNAVDRVFVVAPDHDHITVINASNNRVITEIVVGDEPASLAMGESGTLYVVNKTGTSISVVNTSTLSVTEEVALPYASRPHGIVIDAAKQFAYVALEATGKILKLELPSLKIVGELSTGPVPRELALSGDGATLYAPLFITPPLAGEGTREVSTTSTAGVLEIDASTMSLAATVGFAVNDVSEDDEETGTSSRGIPNYLRAPVISPDGTSVIVPAKLDNIYRGSMRDGKAREHDKLVRGLMMKFDTQTKTEVIADRFDFDNNSAPSALAYDPTGSYIFAIHEGSRAFEVMDAYSNSVIFRGTVEFSPRSLVVSDDGTRVYIHNYLSRTVSVFDTASIILSQSSVADLVATVDIVTDEVLTPIVLLGKQLFHDSEDNRLTTQGYISCAACHDDAGHDGRTWDFSDAGEGLRNTIDLRGRAAVRDGNVHWSANFDEFHDFENDIREIFSGTGLLTDVDFADSAAPLNDATPKAGRSNDLDALAAYGASLATYYDSPFRTDTGALTAAAVTGKQVFIDADCAACHSGTSFTNSPSATGHNIGTVDDDTGGRLGMPLLDAGLDTPTLRGLWHGAPYLHDGTASTLKQAVRAHTNGMTVDVATLSNAQLNSLVAYLLQIDDNETEAPARAAIATNASAMSNYVLTSDLGGIAIDGEFADWSSVIAYANDPNDVSGNNNSLDFAQASIAHSDTHLFVKYNMSTPDNAVITWGASVQFDTDLDPKTGYRGSAGELPIGVEYMIEGSTLHRYTGSGRNFLWSEGIELTAAVSGPELELAVPRSAMANPTSMNVFFFANNESVGGSAVDFYPDTVANADLEASERSFSYDLGEAVMVEPTSALGVSRSNYVNTINVDGNLSDWDSLESFGNDPKNGNNAIDWREAWVAHNTQSVFVAWRNDDAAQMTWGNGIMIDSDKNANTGFTGFNGEMPIGIDFLLEADELYRYTGTGSDWKWNQVGTATAAVAGKIVELVIPRSLLDGSTAMNLFFIGKNEAVGGTETDYFPDAVNNAFVPNNTRYFSYNLLTLASTRVGDNSVDAQSIIDNQVAGVGSMGIGSLWLAMLVLLMRGRRVLATLFSTSHKRRRAGPSLIVASALVISACSDSGEYIGSTGDGFASTDQPNNIPSFSTEQESANATVNPSFAAALPPIQLVGTQLIPPVSTRALGEAELVLSLLSGQLTGQVFHSVIGATGATINIGDAGQIGSVFINLEKTDDNNFKVPAGTNLLSENVDLYQEGGMYISIQSTAYPDGEVRGQISNQTPQTVIEPTLESIQAVVFTPTCSGCHTGTGSTAPAAMNLTSAEDSYNALVNMPSLQDDSKMRVSINDSASSYLVNKLMGTQSEGSQMPFRGTPLDTDIIDAIREWIDTGANL